MSINTVLNGKKYFKELEANILQHEDYKELTTIIYPTFDNWKFKNRRFDSYRKILRKISKILNTIYNTRFVEGFQDSHFTEDEKLLLISIFKFIQRILVFSPNNADLFDKSLWLKYALCFDIEISIQAFKIISLHDRTDLFIKKNDAYVEILIKLINIPNLTLRWVDYHKDWKHNTLDNLVEDTDIIQCFKINRLNYNISDLYIELNKRIAKRDLLILRRVYALISVSSNISTRDFFNLLVNEFSKNVIRVMKDIIKNGNNITIDDDFPLLCFNVFDEFRFCLDTFILYHLTLDYDNIIIRDFLELNDNEGYLNKALDVTESSKFENIMIYSILEELLMNSVVDELDFSYNIKLTIKTINPDLEFRYLCVLYNFVKKDDAFFDKNLDVKYYSEFINNFDSHLTDKDFFVLKLTFKIINEIYLQGNSYFEPFEDSQYLKKCLHHIGNKNDEFFYHCINSITFFINNDPLSIKKILGQPIMKIFEEFIWNEEVIKSLISLFDAISLDKDTKNDFIKSKKLSVFLNYVFNSEDVYLLDSVSELSLHISILLMHHPEYKSGLNEFIKKEFEYIAYLPKKLRNFNTSINMSNFFRFVSTFKLEKTTYFDDKEMLVLLDMIYINYLEKDNIWISSFFLMVKCESIIILDQINVIKYFALKLGSVIFKIIDTEFDQSQDNFDKSLYKTIEKYLFFTCHMIYSDIFMSDVDHEIYKVLFYLVMNILPNLLKINVYNETNIKTLDELIKYRNDLMNLENNIVSLIYFEVEFLLDIILCKEVGTEPTSWFKYFLGILNTSEDYDNTSKRIKTNKDVDHLSCECRIRCLLNNTIDSDKYFLEISMMDSNAVVNNLSENLVQNNTKFFLRIIEKSIHNKNNSIYFLNWLVTNNLLYNERLWSKKSLSILLTKVDFTSLVFYEESNRIKIFDFLIENIQNNDVLKSVNRLIQSHHNFSTEEEKRIIDFFVNNYKKGIIINYRPLFYNSEFSRKILDMKDYKMILKNDDSRNIDVVLYIVNHKFSISKNYVNISIYVLKKLTFNDYKANIKKINDLYSTINILYDQEGYLIFDTQYFMNNFSLILRSREIRKRTKIIYIIAFVKYCKSRNIDLKMNFYSRILNFTAKMISKKNKEDTNILIKSVFHNIFIEISDSYNVGETRTSSYKEFFKIHYLLGYKEINTLRDKFKNFIQENEITKQNLMSDIQKKLFCKCMKMSLKNIFLINIINEIILNDKRYEKFINRRYIKSVLNKYIMPVLFSKKITSEAEYFIAIDFLAYCIRSENDKLCKIVYKIIVQKLLKSKDHQCYNLITILYTSLDNVKIIYCSKERHINDDIDMISEKLIKSGISDKIFTLLSMHKEKDSVT